MGRVLKSDIDPGPVIDIQVRSCHQYLRSFMGQIGEEEKKPHGHDEQNVKNSTRFSLVMLSHRFRVVTRWVHDDWAGFGINGLKLLKEKHKKHPPPKKKKKKKKKN